MYICMEIHIETDRARLGIYIYVGGETIYGRISGPGLERALKGDVDLSKLGLEARERYNIDCRKRQGGKSACRR